MARILVVDDDIARIKRFEAIFRNNPEVVPARRPVFDGRLVNYRLTPDEVPHVVDIAVGYMGATELMARFTYDLVCLDHDLGAKKDGRLVARWMAGWSMTGSRWHERIPGWRCPAKKVLIHSRNPIAAEEMAKIFLEMPYPPFIKLLPYQPAP